VLVRPSSAGHGISIPIAEEADERGSACTTASDHPAANERPCQRAFHIRALVVGIVLVHVIVIIVGLAAVLQQLGDERASHAPPPQDAAGYQEAQELPLAIAAPLLADVLIVLVRIIVDLIL
jgi:hypothetical protein